MEKKAQQDNIRREKKRAMKEEQEAGYYDAEGNDMRDEESDEDQLSGYDEREIDEFNQAKKALLPSVADPKLW